MLVALQNVNFYVHNMRNRLPFRYGIAEMRAVPHLVVEALCVIDGREQRGWAADSLVPKWFTKSPTTTYAQDLDEMLAVIRAAASFAQVESPAPSVFELWQRLYSRQKQWAAGEGHPPLLWNFGVSLVERALIDAFCRARGISVSEAIRKNRLGIDLGALHSELSGRQPAEFLPDQPLRTIHVRHTIGLSDPLTDADIAEGEQKQEAVDDALPRSFVDNIQAYGLNYFKIKVGGNAEEDVARLHKIAEVLNEHVSGNYHYTLDGNEQYKTLEAFQHFWEQLNADENLSSFLQRLLFVEQPLHRSVALSQETGNALRQWSDKPLIIIDESDSRVESLEEALEHGYDGTSHKNCKGIFKGIANACYLEYLRRNNPDQYILSGEDLTTVGPISLLQDLTMMANLGIEHVERNGHHYFKGLSMFPQPAQELVLQQHPDLYRRQDDYASLAIQEGTIRVDSLLRAPFGVGVKIDPAWFTPLEQWHWEPLEQVPGN